MMSKFRYIMFCMTICLMACNGDTYLEDLYIAPEASFSMEKTEYQVLEVVHFSNTGKGTSFVVWPGNTGHCYGVQGDTGFAAGSDGVFSYSYDEPGEYEVVWIASSINGDKDIVFEKTSRKIKVVDNNGGLDKFIISNICKMPEYAGNVYYNSTGEFISSDTILCPILWAAWKDAKVNTIKAKQLITFELTSVTSKMSWYDKSENINREIKSGISTSRIINFIENDKLAIQKFVVETSSGYTKDYYVAPVMIPAFTSFSVGEAKATITRDVSFYNRYDIVITVPEGTDLNHIIPEFTVMNNDTNLLDGTNCKVTVNGIPQVSGVSPVDFSEGRVIYDIEYQMLGADNKSLVQKSQMYVQIAK
ncbi:hypothetical protein [Bacteroides sp.]